MADVPRRIALDEAYSELARRMRIEGIQQQAPIGCGIWLEGGDLPNQSDGVVGELDVEAPEGPNWLDSSPWLEPAIRLNTPGMYHEGGPGDRGGAIAIIDGFYSCSGTIGISDPGSGALTSILRVYNGWGDAYHAIEAPGPSVAGTLPLMKNDIVKLAVRFDGDDGDAALGRLSVALASAIAPIEANRVSIS